MGGRSPHVEAGTPRIRTNQSIMSPSRDASMSAPRGGGLLVHQLALSEIDLPVADRRENCPEYSVRG